MRELKFRTYDFVMQRYDDAPEMYATTDGHLEPSSNKIIEQYTGFTDKNGKEICEGDIVNWDDYENYAVKQSESGAWLIGNDELFGLAPFCEVIGNIHENKELLGGGQ
jgi:hypothetical protein